MSFAVRFLLLAAAFALIGAVADANTGGGDSNKVGFDVLGGFPFSPPAYDPDKPRAQAGPQVDEQLPVAVRKLNGKKVTITGFMLPVRMKDGRAVEFLLLRDQSMCCFGEQPQMNEWVVVRMAKPGAYAPDVPKSFEGTLRVGAIEENGYLSGIYLLENARAAK
ncbi:hypothetical protein M2447_002544 [Ereboglobus sp. PH5-10]|uniref:DUF3299 domain-containing protein n=1 Tax=Ereboglobus sp. PH5-10 TaxID=2940629 RepID=UPI0024050753|nr:DUF3299 domain-containing protein [Ereboglobus sp. PH5-10]MDF9828425.1 hypothetical protein [Ereboglobus sp. PH5-10]